MKKYFINKLFIILLLLSSRNAFAEQKLFSNNYLLSGYFNIHYNFAGSASSSNFYNGLRFTGFINFRNASDKFHFVYRSYHFLNFAKTEQFIYSEPYKNFNIFHTAYLELKGIPINELQMRIGRQFPEAEGAASNLIDGIWLRCNLKKWSIIGSAGKIIDIWNGKTESDNFQYLSGLAWESPSLGFSINFLSKNYRDLKDNEISTNVNIKLKENLLIYGNTAFTISNEFSNQADKFYRASLNLTYHRNDSYFSLVASHWQNSFDQIVIEQKTYPLPYWGNYGEQPPSKYQDVRLSVYHSIGKWRIQSTIGLQQGVRSGWIALANLQTPSFFGLNLNGGFQIIQTNFSNLFALEIGASMYIKDVQFRFNYRSRIYKWLPATSVLLYTDNYIDAEIEYGMLKNFYLLFQGGTYIRKLGDESIKPILETSIIYRF